MDMRIFSVAQKKWPALILALLTCLILILFSFRLWMGNRTPDPSPRDSVSAERERQVSEEKVRNEQSTALDTLRTTVEARVPALPPTQSPPPVTREAELQALDTLHTKSEALRPADTPPPSREVQNQSLDELRAKSR